MEKPPRFAGAFCFGFLIRVSRPTGSGREQGSSQGAFSNSIGPLEDCHAY
jgi:hypothetical protein